MTASTAIARGARPVLGSVTLVAGVCVLQRLGRGALAAPPLGSPDDLLRWAEARDAVTMAIVALRLLTLVLAYHVLATSALVLIGRICRRPELVTWAEAATLPPFRGVVQRLVGVSLSVSTLLSGPVTSAGAAAPRPVVERVVIERIATDPAPNGHDGTATLRLEPAPAPDRPAPPAAPPAAVTHLVRPGDHLWSISEASLHTTLGRPPTDAEIDPYWRRVMAAKPQLADPDLIYPGDLVIVPPPPGGRAATGG